MDIISAPLRLPALRLDGDLMHPQARPLRFDAVLSPCDVPEKAPQAPRLPRTLRSRCQWQWAARPEAGCLSSGGVLPRIVALAVQAVSTS
ncbi:hypothetical protein HaLaN_11823 [Haematococcus lacustris]|uniref:Uncharacterized protein n=1 Tax=Haematococcus lacustris TaxID=44745 RepID=A0A699Z219_HAELA|nr:hypothetical protein HaLaN_11823 [Haematococcus lacustris]